MLEKKGLTVRDPFHIEVTITALNGSVLSSDLLPEPSVIYDPKSREFTSLFKGTVTRSECLLFSFQTGRVIMLAAISMTCGRQE